MDQIHFRQIHPNADLYLRQYVYYATRVSEKMASGGKE